MRSVLTLASAIVLTSTIGCGPRGNDARDAAVAAALRGIEQVNARFQEAYRRGVPDSVVQLLTDDVLFMPNGAPSFRGRDQVRRLLSNVFQGRTVTTYELTTTELDVVGETAYEYGTYLWTSIEADQDTIVEQGRYGAVRKLSSDGTWLIHRLLENVMPGGHPAVAMPFGNE